MDSPSNRAHGARRSGSARGWLERLLFLAVVPALALLLPVSPASAIVDADLGLGPSGPVGVNQVEPGNEIQIYWVQLVDNAGANPVVDLGLAGVNPGIRINVSDLSFPTGVRSSDFSALRLYRSADNVLDGGDTPMVSISSVQVHPVNYNQLDVTGIPIGPAGPRRVPFPAGVYYIISAVISPTAVRGHAFRVSTPQQNIGIDESGGFPIGQDGLLPLPGIVVAPSDGSAVVIGDVVKFLPGSGKAGGIAIPFGGEGAILLALLATGGWVLYRRRLH